MRNGKLNVTINISNKVTFSERKRAINYVSVVITDPIFGEPTLVAGLYLNPDKKII